MSNPSGSPAKRGTGDGEIYPEAIICSADLQPDEYIPAGAKACLGVIVAPFVACVQEMASHDRAKLYYQITHLDGFVATNIPK